MLINLLLAACFSCACEIGTPLREVVVPGLPADTRAYMPARGHPWFTKDPRWIWIERDRPMLGGELVAYCWGAKFLERQMPAGMHT